MHRLLAALRLPLRAATAGDAAVDVGGRCLFRGLWEYPLGKDPESELLGHLAVLLLIFLRQLHAVLYSSETENIPKAKSVRFPAFLLRWQPAVGEHCGPLLSTPRP